MARHPHSNEAPIRYARRLRELYERKGKLERERLERLQQSPPGDTGLLDSLICTLEADIENLSM